MNELRLDLSLAREKRLQDLFNEPGFVDFSDENEIGFHLRAAVDHPLVEEDRYTPEELGETTHERNG